MLDVPNRAEHPNRKVNMSRNSVQSGDRNWAPARYRVHEVDGGHALRDATNDKTIKFIPNPLSTGAMSHGMDWKKFRADEDAHREKVSKLRDMAEKLNKGK